MYNWVGRILDLRTTVRKWGNSLGLRIPLPYAQEAGVEEGSEVDLTVQEGDLIIKPVRRPRDRREDLVDGVTADNLPEEVDTGDPVGREVW